ncbi:transcriptional regulator [Tianweitania sediminis]|uniref:Transcriptional regulator n=1 Tax=Tianweitania sediminis TaxID=1502156 RepID=A0A8J7RJL1_9HYPH|nr:transcriptional regulator [Tianweitania sediminis]MBP0438456.1 transcriptional regulator [Tianweitania sediminis]
MTHIRVHACLECGAEGTKSDFCGPRCRIAFNNRRKSRGAEFYDLYMAHRFERATAKSLGVFQAINRLASIYREEDKVRREGRRSWRAPKLVLMERPFLKAIVTHIRAGR